MNADHTLAFSAHDHKLAALYFDRIFPLYSQETVPSDVKVSATPEAISQNPVLAFAQQLSENPRRKLGECDAQPFLTFLSVLQTQSVAYDPDYPCNRDFLDYLRNAVAITLATGLKGSIKVAVPMLAPNALPTGHTAQGILSAIGATPLSEDVLQLSISGLKAVCTNRAEWAQVNEIRRDKKALQSIRAFRLLYWKEYEGKDAAFIRDDIERRIEEYHAAAKKYGLELASTAFEALWAKDSLLGLLAVSTIATLLGGKNPAESVAIAGAIVELPRVVISVAKKHWAYTKEMREHPFAWVVRGMQESGFGEGVQTTNAENLLAVHSEVMPTERQVEKR